MVRINKRERPGKNIYEYQATKLNSPEAAVQFTEGLREQTSMKRIYLDDMLNSDEGSISTALSGDISRVELLEELKRRDFERMTLITSYSGERLVFQLNLRNWHLTVMLNAKTEISIEKLEKTLKFIIEKGI